MPWLAGLLAVYLVAPFLAGIGQFASADWQSADWRGLAQASTVSLLTATIATLLLAITGIPLGYLLARVPGRMTRMLGLVVQLPLALPPLASGVLLLFLLGYASPIGRLTGGALTDSLAGITLAEAFVSAPFLIIAARSAFAAVDPVLEDVAATLGHPPWRVFCRVSLPAAWRAIVAGMLLAWLRGFGEFGATVMVAYHPYSLPIYTFVAFGSEGLPAMLPVLLPTLGAAIAVMVVAGAVAPTRPIARRAKPRRTLPPARPSSAATPRAIERQPIAFALRRELAGFTLDVGWRTEARRLAILGASGSGKSMTLRLIAGLDGMADSTLFLGGRELSALPPERRGIAYVPQTYGLFPHLTVARQLGFAAGSDAREAARWIERLGLAGLEDRLPGELSLGQQQRVALARALSRPTGLLLLDEPFSALDAPLRARLRRDMRALQDAIAATTILVTHDPDEALLLADEVLILENGRVLQAGAGEAVFQRPSNETAARLLGAEATGWGRVAGADTIDIGDGVRLRVSGPALVPDARVGWSVRPDRVRVCRGGPYAGRIKRLQPAIAGAREAEVELGECVMRAAIEADGEEAVAGPCRLRIDAAAVQVWTTD